MHNKFTKEVKGYAFSSILKDYLDETLELEQRRKLKKDDGSVLNSHDKQDIRRNDTRKVRVLNNHIFRSMANLVYFFEFLNDNPMLVEKFGEDVEELFGLKGPHWKEHGTARLRKKYSAFQRMVIALFSYQNKNTRLQLLNIIGPEIIHNLIILGEQKDHLLGNRIIQQDLGRTLTWIQYITSQTQINLEFPHRTLKF